MSDTNREEQEDAKPMIRLADAMHDEEQSRRHHRSCHPCNSTTTPSTTDGGEGGNATSAVAVVASKPKSSAAATFAAATSSPTKNAVVASLKRKEMESSTSIDINDGDNNNNNTKAAKQARSNSSSNNSSGSGSIGNSINKNSNSAVEVLDLALTLGIQPQSRLEVQWDIIDDDNDDTGAATTNARMHWWGATLLPYDGRTEDGVAVRVLDYDPYPEGGFPDRSQEDVVFIGDDSLFNVTTDSILNYRREGGGEAGAEGTDEEETVVFKGEDGIRDIVNGILSQVMQNNAQRWRGLSAAQQARVAEVVAMQKERLIEALMARPGEVITSSVMKDILEQTLGSDRMG